MAKRKLVDRNAEFKRKTKEQRLPLLKRILLMYVLLMCVLLMRVLLMRLWASVAAWRFDASSLEGKLRNASMISGSSLQDIRVCVSDAFYENQGE